MTQDEWISEFEIFDASWGIAAVMLAHRRQQLFLEAIR